MICVVNNTVLLTSLYVYMYVGGGANGLKVSSKYALKSLLMIRNIVEILRILKNKRPMQHTDGAW